MSEDQEKRGGFFRRIFRRGKTEDIESDRETSETGVESEEPPKRASLEPVEDASTEKAHVSSEPPDQATGLFRLRSGLDKTRNGFIRNLDEVFLGNKQLDDKVVQRLEEVLITADIGVQTAYELLESVTERVKRRELDDPEMVMKHLKVLIKDMLSGVEAPLRVGYGSEPFVVMVLGVNGSGKTTTIAKIAARHKAAGRKVMIVAGDTFRAGAVEQVEIWAERIGCQVVRGKDKADPSSVVFEAIQRAIREDFELVLVDTAGRLHTRVPLMEELKKVHRTMGKKLPQAPHEILLVIDASMGQNAILQARTFNEAVPVTGVCLTKLDGTSKGGVILGISNELKIPIRFIGIGEKMDDLRDFNAGDFVEALFADEKPHR
ncbi:MAG: signal recognition particle-docking protein FtsY [Desulfomonile sp.]